MKKLIFVVSALIFLAIICIAPAAMADAVSPNTISTVPIPHRAVPEPATTLLLGFGLVGVASLKRKFNK